jgi:hypothetical protein
MKFPAAQYVGQKGLYLAVYNHHPDMSVKLPNHLRARHIAHVSYKKGGFNKGFDVFQVNPGTAVDDYLDVNKEVSVRGGGFEIGTALDKRRLERARISETAQRYDVRAEVVTGTDNEVMDLALTDIELFCKGNSAKKPVGSRVEYVQRIIPVTKMRRVKPDWILTSGKQDFIPQCLLTGNIDYSDGCISSWIPEPGARIEGDNFIGFFQAPWHECRYCYAMPDHKPFAKSIKDIDFEQLKRELLGDARLGMGREKPYGKQVEVLRFGKRTEASIPFDFGQKMLARTLEVMIETGTKGVMPTKFHRFDSEMAELFRRTNTAVLYSVSWNKFEHGPAMYGSNNQWRVEQAIRHREEGVNSAIYLSIYADEGPSDRELKMIETARGHKVPVQLLPMRFGSMKLVEIMRGRDWRSMKELRQVSFHGTNNIKTHVGCGDCYDVRAGKLNALKSVHPEWLKIIGNNDGDIRMCHHTDKHTYCGGCFINGGGIGETVHVETKKIKGRFRRERVKKKAAVVAPDSIQQDLKI